MRKKPAYNIQYMSKYFKGFTLIEALIVVVIVAVLAAVSYPSYMEQVRKTNRKQAIGKMFEIAARLEQYRTQNFTYPVDAAVLTDFELGGAAGNRYDFDVRAVDGGLGFNIEAIPQAGTTQVKDLCGKMTLDQSGGWSFSTGKLEDECL